MGQTLLAVEILSLAIVVLILYACVFETKQKSKKKDIFIVVLICSILAVGAAALAWVIEGNPELQWLHYIDLVVSYVSTYATVTMLAWYLSVHLYEKNKKNFRSYKILVVGIYLALPALIGMFSMDGIGYELTFVAMGIDMLLIYITLQAEHENGLIEQHELAYKQAHLDELTGLNNRLSFYEFVEEVKDKKSVGIIFCDLNGLKFTNDNEGHDAGDNLLRSFADFLTSSFKKKEAFRISGDEFVICMPEIPQSIFAQRVTQFKNKNDSLERLLAAIGFSYSTNSDFNECLHNAEMNMYEDKELFYQRFPEYKR